MEQFIDTFELPLNNNFNIPMSDDWLQEVRIIEDSTEHNPDEHFLKKSQ